MVSSVRQLLAACNPRRHLGVRLALAAAGTVLLLSLVLSGLVGYLSGRQLTQAAQRSLNELAFQMADKLDRGMFERYRDVQILAGLAPIRAPDSLMEAQQSLEHFQQSYPDYAWMGLTNREGRVTASTGGLLIGADVSQRTWFQRGQLSPFVGDVHEALLLAELLSNDSDEPLRFVDVSVPVTNQQGTFMGVLGAHLSWSWAEDIQRSLLGPMGDRKQAQIFILDVDGKVLLEPADGATGSKFAETISVNSPPENYVTGIARTRGYRDYPGLGWQVYVRQPAAIALAPARALQWQVLAVGLLLGLGTALWHSLRSHQIVHPLVRLAAAADAIRCGYKDVMIPTTRRQDEIANLSISLQGLVATTRQQQDRLLKINQQLQAHIQRQQQDAVIIQEQAALLDIATDAIIVQDLDWTVRFWNTGAERIYGWEAAEARHQSAYTLLRPGPAVLVEEAERRVLEQGTWKGELSKITKSGQERLMASRWDLVRDSQGQPCAILSVETDITEKKQLQEQLLRTQRLESLGTLASGIAHDLNNIFAPILMVAQLLPLKLPDLSQRDLQLISTLDTSARRGSALVRQILAFARGISGERSPVQLRHVLSEIRQIARSTFPKSIQVRLQLQTASLWLVQADANQLHQVLMNLCVNARDAMLDGGELNLLAENMTLTEARIPAGSDLLPGTYLRITVEDTGTGIPVGVRSRIFEPFFTTKEAGRGTGLGLSTSLGIVKNHGGFMDVSSKEGVGTRFMVYLPAQPDQELAAEVATEAPITGQNELILVVDDERKILETTQELLETYGYRVLTANDGFEAIERYSDHAAEIQLVLTDTQMPDMNGADMVQVLRILNSNIKVIMASGSQGNDQVPSSTTVDSGKVDRFLKKPYALRELLKAIADVLHPRIFEG